MKVSNNRFEIKSNLKYYIDKYYEAAKKENGALRYADLYEEMGEFCGVTPSTISQLKLKGTNPSYIVAIRMANYLEIEVDELFKVIEKDVEKVKDRERCCMKSCNRVAGTKGFCIAHVHLASRTSAY